MKHIRFTPLLLTALLLTGCASGKTTADDFDEIVVITEAPPETTVPETEPETETETEPETEPTTEALPEFDSPQEMAYYYVKETLAEEYGLSDLKTFDSVKGKDDKMTAVTPPTSSQGLISAYVGNLGESTELLTIRCDGFDIICDLYTVTRQECERAASVTIVESTETALQVPAVSLVDGHLVVRREIYDAPGVHYSGEELNVFDIEKSSIKESTSIGVTYDEGTFTFSIGKEKETYDVLDLDFDGIAYSVRDELQNAGLNVDSVRTAFPGGSEFNIEVTFSDETALFAMDFDRDEGAKFNDETSLREYLSGKKKAEQQDTTEPEEDADENPDEDADEETAETEESTKKSTFSKKTAETTEETADEEDDAVSDDEDDEE